MLLSSFDMPFEEMKSFDKIRLPRFKEVEPTVPAAGAEHKNFAEAVLFEPQKATSKTMLNDLK